MFEPCWGYSTFLLRPHQRPRPQTPTPPAGTNRRGRRNRWLMIRIARRRFIAGACAAATAVVAAGGASSWAADPVKFKGKLHKAKIVGPVIESALLPLKEAGFEG